MCMHVYVSVFIYTPIQWGWFFSSHDVRDDSLFYLLYKIQIPIQVLSMFDLKMAFHGKVVIHFGPSK